MLKQHSSLVRQAIAATDVVLITAAYGVAHVVVDRIVPIQPLSYYWLMYAGFTFFYLYFAWSNSLFSVLHFGWMQGLPRRIVMIFLSAGVLGAAILYLMPDSYHGRRLYLAFVALSFVFVGAQKLALKWLFTSLRKRDRNITQLLLFGRGAPLDAARADLEGHPEWGFRIVDTLDAAVPCARFAEVLSSSLSIEQVFFCIPRSLARSGYHLDPYLRVCEEMGRPARVFINLTEAATNGRWQYQNYVGRPSMLLYTVELDPDQRLLKRLLDIAGGLVGTVVFAATYPLFAVMIKLSSPGPVLFRQQRIGRNGKSFTIYKYRSMVADAEQRKEDLRARNQLSGAVFKIQDDPRVTRIGAVLRRFSLDELPQFLNVLAGDMSLVGTRPPTPDEVRCYETWHHRRISIKPGMTGLWQVSGRNRIIEFDRIVALDLEYIDTWSLWLDLKIIARTIVAVVARDGAC
jgi:exopolysaccharide biosynthesis polyprenyl glycosylphosphotransferase